MEFLFTLLLDKFQIPLTLNFFSLESKDFLIKIAKFPVGYWLGYLNMMENVLKSFDQLLYPFLRTLVVLMLAMVKILGIYKNLSKNEDFISEERNLFKNKAKELNRTILKRFSEIYEKFPKFEEMQILTKFLLEFKRTRIEKMALETKGSDAILLIFGIWSSEEIYKPYFLEYPYLKTSIFSLYSCKSLDPKTLSLTTKILLNLLAVPEETHDQDLATIEIEEESSEFMSHFFSKETVSFLLKNLENFFISQKNLKKLKKTHWRPNLDLIRVLLRLSSFAGNIIEDVHVDAFLLMFLPMMEYNFLAKVLKVEGGHVARNQREMVNREKTFNVFCEVLRAFAALLHIKKTPSNLIKYYNHLCNLVMKLRGYKLRMLLIECFKAIKEPEELGVSKEGMEIFVKMNTFEKSFERKLDYEIVVPLIMEFSKVEKMDSLTVNDAQLILFQLFSILEDEEMSLRGSALEAFHSFFENITEKWDKFNEEEKKSIKKFVGMTLIPNILSKIKKNVRCKEEYKIKAYYLLIKYIVIANSQKKEAFNEREVFFGDLYILVNEKDLEQSFFSLIFDVKISKKNQAINLLLRRIKEKEDIFGVESINKLLLPLLNYLVFQKSLEIYDPSNKHPKHASTISNYKTLAETSIEAFGLLVKGFNWANLQRILKGLMHMLERSEEKAEKNVVKMVCAVINGLGMEMGDVVKVVEEEVKKNREKLLNKISLFSSHSQEEGKEKNVPPESELKDRDEITLERNLIRLSDETAAPSQNSLFHFLRTKVLLPLKHHMYESKKNRTLETNDQKIRIFLTVAIVKLIKKFPLDLFLIEFPKVLHNISNSLKSRSLETRDTARKALLETLSILGPHFLYNMIRELTHILQLGYQKHVRNYTIFTLLKHIEKMGVQSGDLDYCIELIVPSLLEEVSGDLQEEKESEEYREKTMEVKRSRVNESFFILAKIVDFENNVNFFKNYRKWFFRCF